MGVYICVLLALSLLLVSATTEHVVYNVNTSERGEEECPDDQQTSIVLNEIDMEVRVVARDTILTSVVPIGSLPSRPANSCNEISELRLGQPSRYYWVRNHNGTAVQVYCDMDRACGCNNTGGWVRIAHLNMSNPSQQCPDAWRSISSPRRTCGRQISQYGGCNSVTFPTHGLQYSHVCGQLVGYEYATPDGLDSFSDIPSITIDSYYVDGISITHGPPGSRQHVWTFAASYQPGYCPCASPPKQSIPPYVGQDYFCETGNDHNINSVNRWFINDPLWDGQDCEGFFRGRSSACECNFNRPPWFCKLLPQATTDDIEVRICSSQETNDEDIPLELIELYIH